MFVEDAAWPKTYNAKIVSLCYLRPFRRGLAWYSPADSVSGVFVDGFDKLVPASPRKFYKYLLEKN